MTCREVDAPEHGGHRTFKFTPPLPPCASPGLIRRPEDRKAPRLATGDASAPDTWLPDQARQGTSGLVRALNCPRRCPRHFPTLFPRCPHPRHRRACRGDPPGHPPGPRLATSRWIPACAGMTCRGADAPEHGRRRTFQFTPPLPPCASPDLIRRPEDRRAPRLATGEASAPDTWLPDQARQGTSGLVRALNCPRRRPRHFPTLFPRCPHPRHRRACRGDPPGHPPGPRLAASRRIRLVHDTSATP